MKQVSPTDWVHNQDTSILKQSTAPKVVNYELQVKANSSDSGHSSPSSSIDKVDKELIPIPLSEAKPRSRPKSQHIPKTSSDNSHRFSYNDNEYHKQNTQISHNPQAFMIPRNKVLPSSQGSSSESSRSTYAEISISKSKLI